MRSSWCALHFTMLDQQPQVFLLLCLFFVFVFCLTAICTRASLGELKDKKIICEEFVKIFGLKKIKNL